jgi:hypothetical protein
MQFGGCLGDRGEGPLQTRIIQSAHSQYQLGFSCRMTSDREAHGLLQCIKPSNVARPRSQLDQLAQSLEELGLSRGWIDRRPSSTVTSATAEGDHWLECLEREIDFLI